MMLYHKRAERQKHVLTFLSEASAGVRLAYQLSYLGA